MAVTVGKYGETQYAGEEVKLIFKLMDADGSGKIDREELKQVFVRNGWTNPTIESVLQDFDKDGSGDFDLIEFWSWINGHDGRSTEPMRQTLLDEAVAKEKEHGAELDEKLAAHRKRKEDQAKKDEEEARKADERAAGRRIGHKDFIKQKMDAGLTRAVAEELYGKADEDHDGEIDKEEIGWFVSDNLATLDQVKATFRKGVAEDGNIKVADIDDGSLGSLINTFLAWDKDGDGCIDQEELGKVLKALNPKFTEVSVSKMMHEMDANDDGFVDVHEFVDWLTGENLKKKKMKKKAKEQQDSKLALGLHRTRAAQAKDQGLLEKFLQAQHSKNFEAFCEKKKLKVTCGHLNVGSARECEKCGGRHSWICHCCGWVNFTEDCVNGCAVSSYGWSCICGTCPKKKCGCKKKPDYWLRCGFTGDLDNIALDVCHIIEKSAED
eukprot:TRINITY_DN48425_c0_g1_i1.p1 TRINITY_DN48425_c0_g1~~TRINITY_DN48425_c0_g1_i1.p1  ORF type:complete len:438 (+),score=131.53 TRINITY_DN48425_c0_g1_i1:140-1453(+)